MNLSSKSRKLHYILIIHVKGYLQTRTTEQSRFSFVRGNAITVPPAIRRRTYCCRSVVSVGSRKSTQEQAIRLLNVGEKDGKASSENAGPNYGGHRSWGSRPEKTTGRWEYGISSRDGHGIVDLTLRHHCRGPYLPARLRQRRCGTFDLISDCQGC